MILFNWKKIVKDTQGRTRDVFVIMHWLTFKTIPNNKQDLLMHYMDRNYEGNSFLINAEPIFYDKNNYSTSEIMQYFSLASYRSFARYVHERVITLDLFHIGVEEDAINNNRLLTLEDGNIHFKYEDTRR
jgi:hypothetical protein